ncbi:hypothetical protein Bhyg_05372, partial [Pseudolycoriella hygida]
MPLIPSNCTNELYIRDDRICEICVAKIAMDNLCLMCDECDKFYHPKCKGIFGKNLGPLASLSEWFCSSECNDSYELNETSETIVNATIVDSSDRSTINELLLFKEIVRKEIDDIKKSQQFLSDMVDKLRTENALIVQENVQLKQQIERACQQNTEHSKTTLDIESEVNKIQQEKLISNMVITNMPKSSDCVSDFWNLAAKIGAKIEKSDVTSIQLIHTSKIKEKSKGKPSSTSNTLLVKFNNHRAKIEMIKNKTKSGAVLKEQFSSGDRQVSPKSVKMAQTTYGQILTPPVLHTINYISTDQQKLGICYYNMRSIVRRMSVLETSIASLNIYPDIVVVTETRIYDSETSFFNIEGYKSFHSARPYCPSKGRGGGTAIFVKDRADLQCNFVSSVHFEDANILRSLVIGDMNINLLDVNDWTVREYSETIYSNGFCILNKIDSLYATRISNTISMILDHIVTDLFDKTYDMSYTDTSISDHRQLVLQFKEPKTTSATKVVTSTVDYERIDRLENWNSVTAAKTFSEFEAALKTIIESNPRQTKKRSKKVPIKPWITKYILDLILRRESLYKLSKRFPTNGYILQTLESCKKTAATAIETTKRRNYDHQISELRGN